MFVVAPFYVVHLIKIKLTDVFRIKWLWSRPMSKIGTSALFDKLLLGVERRDLEVPSGVHSRGKVSVRVWG